MNEVQAPGFVASLRLAPRLTMDHHLAPARPLAAKRQAFFAVQSIDHVPPHLPARSAQHHMDPLVAVAHACRYELVHALPKRSARIAAADAPLG